MDRSQLETMSSEELHDKAVSHATRHMHVGFLWDLIKAIPAAQAASGHLDEAEADVAKASALLRDLVDSGEGDLADALRPLYIDYLEEHA